MLVSWSPDARYLLLGLVKPGKDMTLFYLATEPKQPAELNLNLEAVGGRWMQFFLSARVARSLPIIKSILTASNGSPIINAVCITSHNLIEKLGKQPSSSTSRLNNLH